MYKIAVIPGDRIGKTVVPEAIRVLESTGLNLILEKALSILEESFFESKVEFRFKNA